MRRARCAIRRRATLIVVSALVVAAATGCSGSSGRVPSPPDSASARATAGSPARTVTPSGSVTPPPASGGTRSSGTASGSAPVSSSHPPARPAVTTREGMWWGVDSTVAISKSSIGNVKDWYLGHQRPQFWGRYLNGSYAVGSGELALARQRGIYVYVIVADRNCSQCGGVDVCDNDRTSAQARRDADAAVRDARTLRLPAGLALFKDIEQVSGCRGEPTSTYLRAWYATVRTSPYRVGFYGNVNEQYYDFPRAYCSAVHRDDAFARDVVLDMNEPEPRIGAPRQTTGPKNAPQFAPNEPNCTPHGRTVIWQYGESLDDGNVTDIDQARPDAPGLLAPDGTAT